MQRLLLLLASFTILTCNFAFADSEKLRSKPLRWNSPEIFSKWFKPTIALADLEILSILGFGNKILNNQPMDFHYKSELLLFVDLALSDYLQTPNLADGGKNATVVFEHFGGDASLRLKEEKVTDYIRRRMEKEFKVNNLRQTFSHLGGYSVGRVDAPPSWILEHYIIGPGKFLDDPDMEEFELVEESFSEEVGKIIGSDVAFHKMTPLDEKFENLVRYVGLPDGAPGNMISRLSFKKWDALAASAIKLITGYDPQNLIYVLNVFYDQLEDGTIVVLYGLGNQNPNPIGSGEVRQNNGAYVIKPIKITKHGKEYTNSVVYYIWFFHGQNYSRLGEYIDKFLFTNDGWKKNPVTSDTRRLRAHLELYPVGSVASEINPF